MEDRTQMPKRDNIPRRFCSTGHDASGAGKGRPGSGGLWGYWPSRTRSLCPAKQAASNFLFEMAKGQCHKFGLCNGKEFTAPARRALPTNIPGWGRV